MPPWRQGRSILSMWMPYTYTDTPVPTGWSRASCPGALPHRAVQRHTHPRGLPPPQQLEEEEEAVARAPLSQSAPLSEWQLPLWQEMMMPGGPDPDADADHTTVLYGFKVAPDSTCGVKRSLPPRSRMKPTKLL